MRTAENHLSRRLAAMLAAPCAALLALIVVAGCGGSSKDSKLPPRSGQVMEEAHEYTGGVNPGLAATADGWVVEFHEGSTRDHVWNNVGRFAEGSSFKWLGEPGDAGTGVEPGVAMTDDGRVVAVHRARNGNGLWYSVGRLDKSSGKIGWLHEGDYDTGSYPNVVVFNDGRVLETHMSTAGDDLWYKVGQMNADNTITFSGARSLEGSKCLAAFKDTDKFVQLSVNGYRFGRLDMQNGSISWVGPAVASDYVSSTRKRNSETGRLVFTPVKPWYEASAYAYGTAGDYRIAYVVCSGSPSGSGRGLFLGRARVGNMDSAPRLDEIDFGYMSGGEEPSLTCSGSRGIEMHKSTTMGSGLWYSTGNI